MKTLYLLRHAKPEPDAPVSDFSRTLVPEGEKQAQDLAAYWHNRNYQVDFAMCSAAVRAEQTLENLRDVLGTSQVLVSKNFYGIEEQEMLGFIQECGTQYDRLLYVGHNPGIAFFAMKMAKTPPEEMLQGYAPCSLCVFQIDIDDWSDLNWNMGDVLDYWTPVKAENSG